MKGKTGRPVGTNLASREGLRKHPKYLLVFVGFSILAVLALATVSVSATVANAKTANPKFSLAS